VTADLPAGTRDLDAPTRCEVDDIEVAFARYGSGRPVVMIHGLGQDHQMWREHQWALGGRQTFAYDIRGHGDTTLGDGRGALEQLGTDLLGFLEVISGPASVVGFSLGGAIGLWAAAARPDLVEDLVVLGTSSVVGRTAAEYYEERSSLAQTPSSDAFREALYDDTARSLVGAADQLDALVVARLVAIGDGRGYRNGARAMAALLTDPLTPRLEWIRQRVDVVGATEDTLCPRKAASIMMEALPNATYHEIADAGHLMHVDNPGAVTTILRAVLLGS
jgi:3-oxoadipate enol-lactonase